MLLSPGTTISASIRGARKTLKLAMILIRLTCRGSFSPRSEVLASFSHRFSAVVELLRPGGREISASDCAAHLDGQAGFLSKDSENQRRSVAGRGTHDPRPETLVPTARPHQLPNGKPGDERGRCP